MGNHDIAEPRLGHEKPSTLIADGEDYPFAVQPALYNLVDTRYPQTGLHGPGTVVDAGSIDMDDGSVLGRELALSFEPCALVSRDTEIVQGSGGEDSGHQDNLRDFGRVEQVGRVSGYPLGNETAPVQSPLHNPLVVEGREKLEARDQSGSTARSPD